MLRGRLDYGLGDLAQGLHGLVAHNGFLNDAEGFERFHKDVCKLRAADFVQVVAQFLCEGEENLILVVDGLGEERKESTRVRSGPSAAAIVLIRFVALRRRLISSFFSSSSSTAIG